MMFTALLLLSLGAGEVSTEAVGPNAVASEQSREAVRLRVGIHGVVAGGLSGFAGAIGPGFSAELGATWSDRFSVGARLTFGSILVLSVVMAGVAFDVALSDRFGVGVAPSIALIGGVIIPDLPTSLTAYLPARLTFAPFGRAARDVARKGLVLFVEAAPGYALSISAGFPVRPAGMRPSPVSFVATLGIGYAAW